MPSSLCPCGSEKPLERCCAPVIDGSHPPETAEALLRARFTAFAQKEIDFLVGSVHPAQRKADSRQTVADWAAATEWHTLEIAEVTGGGPDDETGIITFTAHYTEKEKPGHHDEVAEFRRQDGRWFFYDGHPPRPKTVVRDAPKVGRNDPCPCGSGKKYKKCCGR